MNKATRKQKRSVAVLLPDIRSAHNVGSIFRTCDAAGVNWIYLAGHSPCPVDAFGRARKDIAKTALGAEKTIPWKYHKNAGKLIQKLKAAGDYVIAIEQSKNSEDYRKIKLPKGKNIVFIFGNEVEGLPANILKQADVIAELPMMGGKESLNVSVSAGIALFRILGL